MPLRPFLACLDFAEYQTLELLMFPHQEHIWFIDYVFNTPYPTCAFFMHWSCIAHSHALHIATHCTQPPLAHTFATLVMHWSIPYFFILACHVYLMFCSILHCLRFELHFLIHLAPPMHHQHCSYLHLLPSFLLDPLSIPDKKGESILQKLYQRVLSFLYDSCAHPQGKKFYFSCTFVEGEIFHRGDAYTKGEKTLS